MTRNAKLFVFVLLALGLCVFVASLAEWHPSNPYRFFSLLGMAIAASVLRVAVPKMAGDISFSLMFVMIGIVDLPLAETVLIGCSSLIIESVWRPGERLAPVQVFFALANMAVAITCSHLVFHSGYLARERVEFPFRILIAATTCFAVNTFSVATYTSLAEHVSLLKVWQQRAIPRYPQYALAGGVAWAYSLVASELSWLAGLLILPTLYLLQRTYSLYVGRLEDGKKHAEELASLHLRTIEALAGAIEAKDDTTHDHLKRVQVYAVEIGRDLGLNEAELEALRAAAVLHDIGKLAVPEHIISKPGRLTAEEFEKMKVHPVVGAEILERVQFPYPVAPIVRAHHEKWDGTGYPTGLRGEEIPIGSRILSAVDALDALASDRQYRRALPLGEAMAKVAKEAGTAFDPAIIEILKRRYIELERKAHTEAQAVSGTKLSTDIKIERGAAPAAGFEKAKPVEKQTRRSPEHAPFEALALARRDVQVAFESSQPDGQTLSLTECLALFCTRLKRLVNYDAIAVYLLRDGVLAPEYVHGDNHKLFASLHIPVGQGLSGWVAENRRPILNGNPSVEPGYLNDPSVFSTLGSALTLPLEGLSGVIGVLSLYREARDGFSADELTALQAATPGLALSIEQCLTAPQRPSDGEMDIDSTTGLAGARMFVAQLQNELGRAKRLHSPLALFVCRVEGVRALREGLGHAEAAKALRIIGNSLKETCREFDFVARSGAAEFVLIAPGVTPGAADSRLLRLSHLGTAIGGHALSVSTGVAYLPDDGDTPEQLLAAADRNLAEKAQVQHNLRTVALR